MKYSQLLSINADSKTKKGVKKGYLTGIMYLAPAKISGRNFCPNASKGCAKACLYSAGRGKFNSTQQARIKKSRYFIERRAEFMLNLVNSIHKLIRKAERENLTPVVRLNGTSDINWENINIRIDYKFFQKYLKNNKVLIESFNKYGRDFGLYGNIFKLFPNIQFYDYTASIKRALNVNIPNYHLTFSRKEDNQEEVKKAVKRGVNTAVVFDKLPNRYLNTEVINGDLSDLRFIDKQGVIVGLLAKGDAKKDLSGFVINTLKKAV